MPSAAHPSRHLRYRLRGVDDSAAPRDSQRARVYRAESAAFMHDRLTPLPPFGWLTSLEAARAFVRLVAEHPAVVARFPDPVAPAGSLLAGLEVLDGRGRRSAAAYIGRHAIALPQAFRMRWVVLHECAHVVARARHGHRPDYAPHGRHFAAAYVALVDAVFGPAAATRLVQSFAAHRVRWADAALKAAA